MARTKKKLKFDRDIISYLPEAILHHIFSFLDMKYVVQTSILSTKWRYRWSHVPFLNFDHSLFPLRERRNEVHGDETEKKYDFMHFVDHVLLKHAICDIQKLRLFCGSHCTLNKFDSWVRMAILLNVKELDLQITPEFSIPFLPQSLFNCNRAEVIKLNFGTSPRDSILSLTHPLCLPHIKFLHFKSLTLKDDKLVNELISSCPCLETLILENCELYQLKELVISAPRLQHLVIEAYYEEYFGSLNHKIKVYAPNLKTFKCRDCKETTYFLESLSALVDANVDIRMGLEYDSDTDEDIMEIASSQMEEYAHSVIQSTRGLYNAESLTLMSDYMLEVVSSFPAILRSLPTFCKLRHLKLKACLSKDCIRATAYLLENSPNVETLALEVTQMQIDLGNIGEGSEQGWPQQCKLHHLKSIEIQDLKLCHDALEFLKFLLKNATVLEKIVICTSELHDASRKRRLIKFADQLISFPRATSSIVILLI